MSGIDDIVIERHAVVDSTSTAARRRIDAGHAPQRFVVVADEQTAGRGTHERSWSSPARAGLYMTFVTSAAPAIGGTAAPRPLSTDYTLAAGIACAEAIAHQSGVRVRLKPVNDLLIGDRKLGGILTESVVRGGVIEVLLIGIGINLQPVAFDPAQMPAPPISLAEANPQRLPSRDALMEAILRTLSPWIEAVDRGDAALVREHWAIWQQTPA